MGRREELELIACGEDSKPTHNCTVVDLLEQNDPFLLRLWRTRPDADRTRDT